MNAETNTQRDELARTLVDASAYAWEKDGSSHWPNMASALLAAGYRKPRTIRTVEELDAAIVQSFEQGENLVLLDGWRPWIIWENDHGDIRVSSLPVEDDPESLSLSDITLPATVLYISEAAE